jgi:catechol 2,3-dioxygenase-like lactoylglutathione lyase family enzyme
MINIKALHHVRFQVCDLQQSEKFASDFGLHTISSEASIVYMRGAGADAYHYVAEQGNESKLAAIAFAVDSLSDLQTAVAQHGATPIRALGGPGGGQAVSMQDPDGLPIDLVFGIAERSPEPLGPELVLNFGWHKLRQKQKQHLASNGPPQLMRLGHVGIYCKNYPACAQWYTQVLGLLVSDDMYAGAKDNKVCGFLRLNRGAQPVDHHTVFLAQYGKSDLHHVSFEIQDFEKQFTAHKWLLAQGWESIWGVGRHPLGCHVFDVWLDPNGYRFETFTDTDLFDTSYESGSYDAMTTVIDTWRDGPAERYFGEMPEEMKRLLAEQHGH